MPRSLRLLLSAACLLLPSSLLCSAEELDAERLRDWDLKAAALHGEAKKLAAKEETADFAADVDVCAKAVAWIVRHREFYKPDYAKWTDEVVQLGEQRAKELEAGTAPWSARSGRSTVFGYVSGVDGSVQPYAVTLPKEFDSQSRRRWPLHVVLHGRADQMNEVSFLHQFEGKSAKKDIGWIQLDVFGRTNNAYRWAGEADVFEALAATRKRFPIDDRRMTLWGFSMGGAGAWHLGLHYPDRWSSVGAGAGFVDTVNYMNLKEPLSPLHQKLVRIYDATGYALNAADVPVVGYGGELDKQLLAAKTMHSLGETLGVEIKLLVGPQTEHKFHPESEKKFLAFHAAATERGRAPFPGLQKIRFRTFTPKYNTCEWMTLEEQNVPYEQSTIEAARDDEKDLLTITTKNCGLISVARDVAANVVIDDGDELPLRSAASGLLPSVYFEQDDSGWRVWDYRPSHEYLTGPVESKRHNLQGPIDDAFMRPFICVRGTGTPWTPEQKEWSDWTLDRFRREYDKFLRAEPPVINDTQVTEEMLDTRNLILFGDPGSNSVLARVVDKLPIQWSEKAITVRGESYSTQNHGLALIYPNPLNPRHYVVINSGHTFHEAEFKASNAQLYPRLGDVAVIQFRPQTRDGFAETTLWSDLFDVRWQWNEP